MMPEFSTESMFNPNVELQEPSPSVAASPHWQASTKHTSKKGFTPFVAFCFTINYILGTGFLTLPWAFTQGGLILSTILLVGTGMFADMAKNYLLESMARAEAMLDRRLHWIQRSPGEENRPLAVYSPIMTPSILPNGERDGLVPAAAVAAHDTNPDKVGRGVVDYETMGLQSMLKPPVSSVVPNNPIPLSSMAMTRPTGSHPGTPTMGRRLIKRSKPKYAVKERKFEVNTLCRVFLGKTGLNIYTFFICLYIFCALWAYTSVFSSAMARGLPILGGGESVNYLLYAILFALLVVPMSCLELDEQIQVQVALTACRVIMLILMLSTCHQCAAEASVGESSGSNEIAMFRLGGLHTMLPIVVFAHIYHHSIPGLSHPVDNKRKLRGIFQSTCVFSTLSYALVGVVLASAFGPAKIEQSSNLNWQAFHGGTGEFDEEGNLISAAWWAKAVSMYIVLFPAFDVLSAFPLNAVTLGNNMMSSYFGSKIHEVENNRWIRVQFRMLAACPPIMLAIWVRELGKITDFAGTTGFVIGFSFPALLYPMSKRKAVQKNFLTSTFYESYCSSDAVAWLLCAFGILMLLYVSFYLAIGD